MEIRDLQYFICAAEKLNFTSAAKECYITQTAMSLHIGKMEETLGFKLFIRGKRAVALTEAGKDFYKHAKDVVRCFENAVSQSTGVAEGVKGAVRVVMPSSIEAYLFMDKFLEFRRCYIDVEFSIRTAYPHLMLAQLKNGEVDMAIGSPEDLESEPEIKVELIREDPMLFICGRNHRLAGADIVTHSMMKNECLIVCEPAYIQNTFRTMRDIWANTGFEPTRMKTVNNLEEVLIMVELGLGVGTVPGYLQKHSILEERKGIAFINCSDQGSPPRIKTALAYNKNNENKCIHNLANIMLKR